MLSADPIPVAPPWYAREDVRRRLAALGFVLLLHLGLALLFLSLAPPIFRQKAADLVEFSFITEAVTEQAAEPEQTQTTKAKPETTPEPQVEQPPVPPATPPAVVVAETRPVDPPIIPPPETSTALAAPPAPPSPPARPPRVYGPPNDGPKPQPDSVRVEGTGPNGEPLYAAQWYREPYDEELRGYLSTARGPGWGLVACRTAPNYRVEDCVIVGEYPTGSGIANSVHAAAWQFRVRPPRVGGRDQVGQWVRIRIDYEQRSPYAR